jgi:hypothetical protein
MKKHSESFSAPCVLILRTDFYGIEPEDEGAAGLVEGGSFVYVIDSSFALCVGLGLGGGALRIAANELLLERVCAFACVAIIVGSGSFLHSGAGMTSVLKQVIIVDCGDEKSKAAAIYAVGDGVTTRLEMEYVSFTHCRAHSGLEPDSDGTTYVDIRP